MVRLITFPIRLGVYFALLPLALALDVIDPIIEELLADE